MIRPAIRRKSIPYNPATYIMHYSSRIGATDFPRAHKIHAHIEITVSDLRTVLLLFHGFVLVLDESLAVYHNDTVNYRSSTYMQLRVWSISL